MNREPILLTPGPLSTSLQTKLAMLRDWGSWDSEFNAITARLCESLLQVIHGQDSHVVVPLQGSGTFSVEAAVASLVPRNGHLLVLDNGAYSQRAAKLTQMMGRRCSTVSFAEDQILCAKALERALVDDASISHVLIVHCETGSGLLNPLETIAAQCERFDKSLIVDAMSTFAALPIDTRALRFDALVAASGKCLEGVPGMGFVFIRRAVLSACEGRSQSLAMDLFDQYDYMQRTGQWRFTPPTQVVAALIEAIAQFEAEGGQPARLKRYQDNCQTLIKGMLQLGFKPYLDASVQAPIIVSFHAPADPAYDFKRFYAAVRDRGFVLYPGKLTRAETFRVGCIGAIGRREIEQALHAIELAAKDLGLQNAQPLLT
ncbi:MAG: 2-aminoethylphosphonate--pyruvate transaminase [Betaproteobacteria bacterium]|nr:2-aminoethylphosphonate--pyruvate transaminase [Betaproteobacteria bacterium]NCZ81560.1 2-aminoethylphosphonate--pyruvate transaminase [Betaproteobacteria bacterium]